MAVVPLLAALACGSAEEKAAEQQRAERTAMSEVETTAASAAAAPATGLWSEAHLLDRLVRAGVAPRRMEDPPVGPDWMPGEPIAINAGGGQVFAWIFTDSTARRAVTGALEERTGAPEGRSAPYASPMRFIVQNNLAAYLTGGTERNQDRVALALTAGLPVSSNPGTTP